MPDRVLLFNRKGVGLADLRVTVERTWLLSGEGEAEFDLVTTDPACREDFLRFGNWILVQNDKLGDWVGVIDVPQEWKRRRVHVCAYTPEHMYTLRDVPKSQQIDHGSSGDKFRELLNIVNRAQSTVIVPGSIWNGGKEYGPTQLSGDSMLDCLKHLVSNTGGEYWFDAVYSPVGGLQVRANWYQKVGQASAFALTESYNLEDADGSVTIQGKFANELWGYGNGASDASRPTATVQNNESISVYGLRQATRQFDYTSPGLILDALKSQIQRSRWPKYSFQLSALDVGDTWNQIRVGNVHPLRMWSVGFGIAKNTRILSMYYNPRNGKVDLSTNEILDDAHD